MNKKTKIIIAVVIIAVGALAFFGGMKYAQGKTRNMMQGGIQTFQSGNMQGMQRGGTVRSGTGFAGGEIISVDERSITIKLPNGGSQIILIGSSTAIMKSTAGSVNDLSNGQNVTVTGSTNSDGSLSATSVQIRPAGTTSR